LDARTSYHMLFGMFGSMLWWPILATVLTIISVIYSSNINNLVGVDFLTVLGGEIWQQTIAVIVTWILLIFLFWLSAVSFATGWDAVADFARWNRRLKTNSLVKEDLAKLRDLLN